MSAVKRLMAALDAELADLPSVNLKAAELVVLDLATGVVGVVLCFVPHTADAMGVFGDWLEFLAAIHGATVGAFWLATRSATTTAGGQQVKPPAPPAEGD